MLKLNTETINKGMGEVLLDIPKDDDRKRHHALPVFQDWTYFVWNSFKFFNLFHILTLKAILNFFWRKKNLIFLFMST